LVDGVLSGLFGEALLPRHQWLKEGILRGDDKAAHPGFDIDQLFKSKLRFTQHLIGMHIAVGGLFDLLKAPVSTRDQNGDKYDDRGKAEVKLLRDTEFAEHDVDPEHSRSMACMMGAITRKKWDEPTFMIDVIEILLMSPASSVTLEAASLPNLNKGSNSP